MTTNTQRAAQTTEDRKVFLCKLHPDFHMPADVDIGVGFDADAYAARLASIGVDAVAFFAKCHYGHAYYDTKVGTKHPRLDYDMFAAVAKACATHDLGLIAYFSVFLDTVAVEAHPDWELQATDSKVDAGFDSGNYRPVCVNSAYLEELFIPQAIEIATQYKVDEILLDTMTGFKPCYCSACKASFGRPIPHSSDEPHWLEYVAWYRDSYDRFFERTADAIAAANPNVAVAFNWEWGVRRPTDPPAHIARITADLIPTGVVASEVTHYSAGTGFPHDYMCGRFLDGLGDWNNNTRESILYTASATIANGASFYIIDRQLPDGSLEERGWEMARDVFSFVQQRHSVVVDTEHVAETALLHSYNHQMGDRLQFFPEPVVRQQRMAPFEGASRMFMFHARHYTAISVPTLLRDVDRYQLVIVPETEFMEDETVERLAGFVESGGRLLITQSPGDAGVHEGLLELAGVRIDAFSPLEYTYFGELPEPNAASGRCALAKPVGGAVEIVRQIAPLRAGHKGAKFGHGRAPAHAYEGYAAATERRVGKGTVIYCALPIFGEYWRRPNPHAQRLMWSLLDRIQPSPIVKVSTGAQVEMTTMRKGDDLIVHLVNHSGRELLIGNWYPVTEYMPVIRDIGVAIRLSGGASLPTMPMLEPSHEPLAATSRDGYAHVTVPELEFMQSIVVAGHFGGGQ
ncbi:MAG: hypothetical protein EA382_16525 [Spirochaetaceae bacterium]|nr:MAG: hypothetical protein EA382_16525 [Spirochaetaceae bacterium]